MGKAFLPRRDAFDVYLRFATLPEVGICTEPAGCESHLRSLLDAATPARMWTDAYLAAFAATAGLRLVTFDKDFARFGGIARLQLSPR